MGIKERHERDREAVKRAILDAARDLFVSEGYENVSIRKIAERIEYSPAAIYSYFPSKDEIFIALAEEGVRLFGDCNTGPLDGLPAIERLRSMVLRLYRFSIEHPQYFALMFVDRTVPRICREYERFAFAREMRQELIAELEHAADEGVFPKTIPAASGFSDSDHGRPGSRGHASLGPAHRGKRGRPGERRVECHAWPGSRRASRWSPDSGRWRETQRTRRRKITRGIGSMRTFRIKTIAKLGVIVCATAFTSACGGGDARANAAASPVVRRGRCHSGRRRRGNQAGGADRRARDRHVHAGRIV